MAGKRPPEPSLRDLTERIEQLKAQARPAASDQSAAGGPTTALGMAFMVAAHLVSGLAVGAFIGYWLDRWLDTAPGFLVGFFLLGAAAGGMNIYRTVRGYGMAVGYQAHRAPSADASAHEAHDVNRKSE